MTGRSEVDLKPLLGAPGRKTPGRTSGTRSIAEKFCEKTQNKFCKCSVKNTEHSAKVLRKI